MGRGHRGSASWGICRSEVDAVIFFSPSAVEEFVRVVGSEALGQIGAHVTLTAVGPVTAEAIRAAGVRSPVEAAAATSSRFGGRNARATLRSWRRA